jgi:hypothetical protein
MYLWVPLVVTFSHEETFYKTEHFTEMLQQKTLITERLCSARNRPPQPYACALGYRLHHQRIWVRIPAQRVLSSLQCPGPALGLTQPPIQWVSRVHYEEVTGCKPTIHLPLMPKLKIWKAIPQSPQKFHGRIRDNFICTIISHHTLGLWH